MIWEGVPQSRSRWAEGLVSNLLFIMLLFGFLVFFFLSVASACWVLLFFICCAFLWRLQRSVRTHKLLEKRFTSCRLVFKLCNADVVNHNIKAARTPEVIVSCVACNCIGCTIYEENGQDFPCFLNIRHSISAAKVIVFNPLSITNNAKHLSYPER